jgi:hypothetical protein
VTALLVVTRDRAVLAAVAFLDVDVLRADDATEAGVLHMVEPDAVLAYGPDMAFGAVLASRLGEPVELVGGARAVVVGAAGDAWLEEGRRLLGAAEVVLVPDGLARLVDLVASPAL